MKKRIRIYKALPPEEKQKYQQLSEHGQQLVSVFIQTLLECEQDTENTMPLERVEITTFRRRIIAVDKALIPANAVEFIEGFVDWMLGMKPMW